MNTKRAIGVEHFMDIYGQHRPLMEKIMNDLVWKIESIARAECGDKLFEHITCRIKSDKSARDKLKKKGLDPTDTNAILELNDSIGIRVVCLFINDVYECVRLIKTIPGCSVVNEKDYINNAKPNGYRSYHMIVAIATDETDINGEQLRQYFAEIQLRTIAMDTWAALEHELKYKKHIKDQEMIVSELHRCANDLAACDVSMQILRQIIRDI